jgi:hypothetical protein
MQEKKGATSTVVAKVNNVPILLFKDNNENRVPIKPICEILGIAPNVQIEKIKNDEILSSVSMLSISTGSDGKQYEMITIPLKYVFGWLFTINPKNVNPEAKDLVLKYKKLCYDILYKYFVEYKEFVEERQKLMEEQIDIIKGARKNFRTARSIMYDAEKTLDDVRYTTFEMWKNNKRVQKLPFPL